MEKAKFEAGQIVCTKGVSGEKIYGIGELYSRNYKYITCPCCKQKIVLKATR